MRTWWLAPAHRLLVRQSATELRTICIISSTYPNLRYPARGCSSHTSVRNIQTQNNATYGPKNTPTIPSSSEAPPSCPVSNKLWLRPFIDAEFQPQRRNRLLALARVEASSMHSSLGRCPSFLPITILSPVSCYIAPYTRVLRLLRQLRNAPGLLDRTSECSSSPLVGIQLSIPGHSLDVFTVLFHKTA
jgi:hypothetical protein